MIGKKEIQPPAQDNIETALHSGKADYFLFAKYCLDRRHKDFDANKQNLGLIVTVESDEVNVEGTLSRGQRDLAVLTSYAKIPEIVENAGVQTLDWCDDEIIRLLQSAQNGEVVLKNPVVGPEGDEWDSPAWNSFWDPVEQVLQGKVETLRRVGATVRVE